MSVIYEMIMSVFDVINLILLIKYCVLDYYCKIFFDYFLFVDMNYVFDMWMVVNYLKIIY